VFKIRDRCQEKERLLIACATAADIYKRGVSDLIAAAGTMAYNEFEFLSRRVAKARLSVRETRVKLDKHTAEHGC
jgi:hypothetical protein